MLLEVCRDHHAQYFYMAPKFPYSLPFDHQVRTSELIITRELYSKLKKSVIYCERPRLLLPKVYVAWSK